ncbi:3-deoxy-manno-octulosonate cytidylyltransferase [Marinivivus vitaminiproducens]|uniref:3-deoxy-manno-octulosonate cytidylyltransferase n=1 Tax=Marinivivus vitaminiproducens TaxID=3035935 RepID=UPI00279CCABC|nr:3-deoxy-manno-octulosonate cytidylyltransferase [Geminicoccaceae bacterium SCSIO 64248]
MSPSKPSSDRSTLTVIPARLASTRLPDKPLADIAGQPMIVHVWRRAMEAALGPVVVACADRAIADAVERAGGHAVMTDPAHPNGTDRVREAVLAVDPDGRHEVVVNLQGDMPTMDPDGLRAVAAAVSTPGFDMATLVVATDDPAERDNPNAVKAIVAFDPGRPRFGRALYFTRAAAPTGPGPIWHHVGVYAFRRSALERYAGLPPSPLEIRERLEQLRALEAGMTIAIAEIDALPRGVDSPADLEWARRHLGAQGART